MPRASLRQQIFDAAMDQFHQHGYNGCGVKDITDAAHAPKGSFYNHFESKEALALEVLRRYEADCALDALRDTAVEPITRLRMFFEAMLQALERFQFARGCLFGNFGSEMAGHSDAMRTQIEESLGRWASSVAMPLNEAKAAGALAASQDPDRLARSIVDAWQGAVVRAKVTRSRDPLDDFFAVVFDGLLAR